MAASGKEIVAIRDEARPGRKRGVLFRLQSRSHCRGAAKSISARLDGRVDCPRSEDGQGALGLLNSSTREKKKGANFTSPADIGRDGAGGRGPTGGDIGQRGQIYGIDAETGKRLWEFDTIRNDQASWPQNSGDTGGWGVPGCPAPTTAETDTVYIGNRQSRLPTTMVMTGKGDNLYTSTLLALDAKTGKLKWHHQEIPHDVWDFDSPYESILFERDGKKTACSIRTSRAYAFPLRT